VSEVTEIEWRKNDLAGYAKYSVLCLSLSHLIYSSLLMRTGSTNASQSRTMIAQVNNASSAEVQYTHLETLIYSLAILVNRQREQVHTDES
jgi:hypothetical protein